MTTELKKANPVEALGKLERLVSQLHSEIAELKGQIKPKRTYNRMQLPPGLSEEERKAMRSRICSLNYYYNHREERKNNPEFMEKKRDYQRKWRQARREARLLSSSNVVENKK